MGTFRDQTITVLGVIPRWFDTAYLSRSVTEADPRPGVPVTSDARSRLYPVISGGQASSVYVAPSRAGMPGTDPTSSARVRWTDSVLADYRGWTPYQHLMDRQVLGDIAAAAEERAQQVVALPDGKRVLAVYAEQGTNDGVRCRLLDGDTDSALTWGAEVTVYTTVGSVWDVAAVALPSGRVVVFVHDDGLDTQLNTVAPWIAMYSDDNGATWATYSTGIAPYSSGWTDANSGNRARAAVVGDAIVLVRQCNARTLQAVSYTLGTSFENVYDGGSVLLTHPDVLALPGGAVGVSGQDSTTNYPSVWRLTTPRTSIADVTASPIISAGPYTTMTAWVDTDGAVWAAITSTSYSFLRRSVDGGLTWPVYGVTPGAAWHQTTAAGSYPRALSAAPLCGRAVITATALDASGTEGRALAAYVLGGWSQVEGDACDDLLNVVSYLPHDLPTSQGWGASGTAGVESITSAGLALVPTGSQARSYLINTDSVHRNAVIQFATRVSGGAPSVGFNDHEILYQSGDGATRYIGQIRFSSTQISILDNGSAIATINWDATAWTVVYAEFVAATATWRAWASRPGSTEWTEIGSGALTGGASVAGGYIQWGKIGSYSNSCEWRYFWYDRPAAGFAATSFGALRGRPWPATGAGYVVLPGIGSSAQAARLSARGGPATMSTDWAIDPSADRPSLAIMPQVQPSPRRGHESAGNTEQVWTWTLNPGGTQAQRIPDYLVIAVMRCNWRTAYVETWDGSTWTTRGTIDLAYSRTAVQASVDRYTVAPFSGVGARYMQRNEVSGGSVVFGGSAYEIAGNSEGTLNNAGKTARIDLVSDTGASTTTTVAIVSHSGCMVLHDLGLSPIAIRLRIPSQSTPSGTIKTGGVMICEAVAPGYAWGWGMSRVRQLNADSSEDGSMVSRVRQRGPSRRVWTVDWTDGADQIPFRQATPDPDWSAPTGGSATYPMLNIGDMSALEALADETRNGELPIIALAYVPGTSGVTVTDPTVWLYGRMTGAPEVTMVLGEEGESELIRVGSVTVEEIP